MLSKYKKLVIVFVGLLAMSGVALAELGPPPGVGENGQQQGDNDRGRSGECKDLIGVSGIHGGQCGEGNQQQKGRDDSREGEGNCGGQCGEGNQHKHGIDDSLEDAGNGQGPYPGYGGYGPGYGGRP